MSTASTSRSLEQLFHERIVLLDGAMGSLIQSYPLTEKDFRGERFAKHPHDLKGNNDLLSLTRPDLIEEIHSRYFAAGADVAETNTFSSTAIAQGDYRLESIVTDLNTAAVGCARRAAKAAEAATLLANIYLSYLDRIWASKCKHLGLLVRYADDFVVMCKTQSQANEAKRRIEIVMQRLGLMLHPEKTRIVRLNWGKEGFNFLGWHVRKRRSIQRNPRWHFVQRWPSPKAMKNIRARIDELTDARRGGSRGRVPLRGGIRWPQHPAESR